MWQATGTNICSAHRWTTVNCGTNMQHTVILWQATVTNIFSSHKWTTVNCGTNMRACRDGMHSLFSLLKDIKVINCDTFMLMFILFDGSGNFYFSRINDHELLRSFSSWVTNQNTFILWFDWITMRWTALILQDDFLILEIKNPQDLPPFEVEMVTTGLFMSIKCWLSWQQKGNFYHCGEKESQRVTNLDKTGHHTV